MEELLYSIWLSLACSAGSESFAKLLLKFNSPKEIFLAEGDAICSCINSKSKDYDRLIDKDTARAEEILDFCQKKKVGILTYFDPEFPNSLRSIKNPPVLLYYRGILPDFNNGFYISVVGTRRLSDYGRTCAFRLAYDLALSGATVVSGMATGIDGVALAAAVSADVPTVAVIGSGIDVCYPPQHKRLAQNIVKRGCVMTEYAPGTPPERQNFPTRNRIVSGLSRATVVVEGNERSGSLITARLAKEQERAVYAFPGNVGNKESTGSNLLIKNGATLITSADDILRDFEDGASGLLDPFSLPEKREADMFSVLRELEVSCVTPSDDVFRSSHTVKRETRKNKAPIKEKKEEIKTEAQARENDAEASSKLDRSTFDLYKKIPLDKDCAVDELVDDEHSLRDVMQGILKLELLKFVTMLPGDRVKRNL
jgi:DNA processing protein